MIIRRRRQINKLIVYAYLLLFKSSTIFQKRIIDS